jgi:hypothetical protein
MISHKIRPVVEENSLGILSQVKNILEDRMSKIGLKTIVKARLTVL